MTSDGKVWIEEPAVMRPGHFQLFEGNDMYASSLLLTDAEGLALLDLLVERVGSDWLARVKREAASEALEEAAQHAEALEGAWWDGDGATAYGDMGRHLRARAAELREGK